MALSVVTLQPGKWTEISDSGSNISFQNISGSSTILIRVDTALPDKDDHKGFIYRSYEKVFNVAISDLSVGNGTVLYGRPASGWTCNVLVEDNT